MIDRVDVEVYRLDHIVLDERETWVTDKVLEIDLAPGDEVVDADHVVPVRDEVVAQVRSDEARASRHQNTQSSPLADYACMSLPLIRPAASIALMNQNISARSGKK